MLQAELAVGVVVLGFCNWGFAVEFAVESSLLWAFWPQARGGGFLISIEGHFCVVKSMGERRTELRVGSRLRRSLCGLLP